MNGAVTFIGRSGAVERHALASLLTPALKERVREESAQWIKRLRLVEYDGVPMRERFTYAGDSLWWFTELYLHKMRRLDAAVGTVLALEHGRELFDPARVTVETRDRTVADAATAFAAARGLRTEVSHVKRPLRARTAGLVSDLAETLTRWKRPWRRTSVRQARIAAFVHTAFWTVSATGPGEERYVGPVLAELATRVGAGELACVGLGPRRNFRARRWWDPIVGPDGPASVLPIERLVTREALGRSTAFWRERRTLARAVVSGAGARNAGAVLGVDLWPVLSRELRDAALVQWPWSARAIDEAGAAIDALAPAVVVTYAEAGGWGRALVIAARQRGVPSVGLQHGFIYRHWLNYRHEPDEIERRGSDRGFPAPDRTLLFDAYAQAHLEQAGHLPRHTLVVTGSAGLDGLARRVRESAAERDVLRRDLGAGADDRLLVLAAKFTEIRDELPALVAAIAPDPSIRLVIKTHPAETDALYGPFVSSVPHIKVLPATHDLAPLLAAADGLVTMNSTVAIDALVLGVPALVIGWPTNLSPFVEAGVMLGGPVADVPGLVRRLLYDQPTRDDLRRRAAEFTRVHHMQADGRAAIRAADHILALAT